MILYVQPGYAVQGLIDAPLTRLKLFQEPFEEEDEIT